MVRKLVKAYSYLSNERDLKGMQNYCLWNGYFFVRTLGSGTGGLLRGAGRDAPSTKEGDSGTVIESEMFSLSEASIALSGALAIDVSEIRLFADSGVEVCRSTVASADCPSDVVKEGFGGRGRSAGGGPPANAGRTVAPEAAVAG